MNKIPDGITTADVESALEKLTKGDKHEFGESTGYDLIKDGHRYPPKAVLGLAATRLVGHPLGPYDFKGGEKSQCFRVLRELGYVIEKKAEPVGPGEDWTEDEVRALVEDYFDMLAKESAGKAYSKKEHREHLLARLPGRSKGSVEFKHQNVSGVLNDLGFPCIEGYKPARNYQKGILPEVVLEHLGSQDNEIAKIEDAFSTVPESSPSSIDFSIFEVGAPVMEPIEPSASPTKKRKARRYDFASRDAANRKLGRAGEELVLKYEKWNLEKSGRADLAARVEWVSETQGDGLGFDILSFDATTNEAVYIEVKTTNCGRDFPFYVSANEVESSATLGPAFRLFRVFNFSSSPQVYQLPGNLADTFQLLPRSYEARRR
jgi:hypothetical protein